MEGSRNKKKIKTIDDINQEEFIETLNKLMDTSSLILEQILEDEPFLVGADMFDNMEYGSRRFQDLCNLIFGKL